METQYADLTRQIEAFGGQMTFIHTETVPAWETDENGNQVPVDANEDGIQDTEEVDVPTYVSVTLQNALDGDPTLAAHPDFPIVLDKGTWVVRNVRDAGVLDAGEYTDVFDEIVPITRENPPVEEINQAGIALWRKTVKELEDRSAYPEVWSMKTTFMPAGFRPGDRVFVQGTATRLYRDRMSGTVVAQDIGTVAGWFRVPRFSATFDEAGASYSVDLSQQYTLAQKDPLLELYETAASGLDPNFSDNVLELNQYAVLHANLPAGLVADCYNVDESGFYPGRTVSVPLVDVPVGVTTITIYGQPVVDSETGKVRIVSLPSLPASPAQLCVSVNRNWTLTSSVDVYLLVKYT